MKTSFYVLQLSLNTIIATLLIAIVVLVIHNCEITIENNKLNKLQEQMLKKIVNPTPDPIPPTPSSALPLQ